MIGARPRPTPYVPGRFVHSTLRRVRVIGFDTATDETVVGALDGDRSVYEFHSDPPTGARPTHSADLVPAIEEAASALGGWDVVDRVAVGVGPGTFTGLRIAIATARGIRLSSEVEVVPVCTLLALSFSFEAPADRIRVPVLDARRNEVFLAAYGETGTEVIAPVVGDPGELFGLVATSILDPVIAGPGAVRFRSDLEAAGLKTPEAGSEGHRLSGSAICLAAAATEPLPDNDKLEPIYLRAPDAERWSNRGTSSGI